MNIEDETLRNQVRNILLDFISETNYSFDDYVHKLQNGVFLIDNKGKVLHEIQGEESIEEMVEILEYEPDEFEWLMQGKKPVNAFDTMGSKS